MPSTAVQPILVLLGQPVAANPSQYVVEKAFAHHELDWRYLTAEVGPERLEDAVRGMRALGFCGGHVAEPHKEAVLALVDEITQIAGFVGAANLLVREGDRLIGANNEGLALVRALERLGDPMVKRVVLLGAGRMGRAVALELARAGVEQLTIFNRTPARAEALVQLVAEQYHVPAQAAGWPERIELPAETDVLIHATALRLGGPEACLPLDPELLSARMVVADVGLEPSGSWLLGEARRRGCPTIDGLSVFLEQLAASLALWTGVEPDLEVMREAAEEFLEL